METPSRHTFNLDGSNRVFPIPSAIKGDNYCRLEIDSVVVNDRAKYDIVNNSIVFLNIADVPAGSVLDVLVVQSEESLGQLSITTNIDIVADDIANVNIVGINIADVNTVAGNTADIDIVSANTTNINTVAGIDANVTTVAGIAPNVTTVAGNTTNVNTVAGNTTNINTVAGINADVTTVAGISANVTSVVANETNINTVAADGTDIGLVAGSIASVNTTATNIASVNTNATNIADINTVAADGTDIGLVAGSIASVNTAATNIASVNTNAANIADINTNATNIVDIQNAEENAASALASKNAAAISETNSETSNVASEAARAASVVAKNAAETAETNAATSETNAATSETNAAASEATATTGATTATAQAVIATNQAVAAAASAASITDEEANSAASAAASASSATDSANSAASAAAALDNFDDRYLGPKSSEPTLDNDGDALVSGALYFATTSNAMQVYDGANWIAASAAGVASMNLYEYTATAGQTTFTGADDNNNSISFIQGNEIVVFNGIILDPSDYNSTTGTSIVLNVGAALNDLINVYAFKSFTVADTVSASAGGTFGGDVTVTGTLAATTLTGDGSAITGLPAGYTDTDVATYLAGTSPTVGGLTTTADMSFGDNDKAVFGAGSDLQIYHDGSGSYIEDAGTGSLTIKSNTLVIADTGGDNMLVGLENGEARLYNNGSQKLATTTTGIDVTGTVSADKLNVTHTGGGDFVGVFQNTTSATPYGVHIKDAASGANGYPLLQVTDSAGSDPYFLVHSGTGNVGIGTAAPNANLHTAGSSTNTVSAQVQNTEGTGSRLDMYAFGSSPAIQSAHRAAVYQWTGAGIDMWSRTGDLHFGTSNVERMRIDSSGNLLVGTTTEGTWSANNSAILRPSGVSTFTSTSTPPLYANRLSTDGTILDLRKDGSTVGSIGTRGSQLYVGTGDTALKFLPSVDAVVGATAADGQGRDGAIDLGLSGSRFKDGHFSGTVNAANFNTTSDATLKTNVETLTGSLDAVKSLRGVSYDWIESGGSEIGVIAQEVEAVLPDVVSTNDEGIKSVKYGNMVAVLIEAIKEQQVQIDELKAQLNS